MNDKQFTEQELNVFKWGGLAGMSASVLFVLVMVFVGVFIGDDPKTLTEWVLRFPDIHIFRIIENIIYLTALLLVIPLLLALFLALRKSSLAPSLFGTALVLVGLISMIISSTPHIAHTALSNLYSSSEITTKTQEVIPVLWQSVWGVFYAPLYVGFFIMPLGILLLGVAMFSAPFSNRIVNWVCVLLGILGFFAAVFQLINPESLIGAVSYLSLVIFSFIMGRKVNSLSK